MTLPKRPHLPSLGGYRQPEVKDLAARLSAWGTGVNGVLDALPKELAGLERRMTELEASAGGGAPDAHATTHQNGGTDEISVAGLSGLLDDAQTPLAHETSHREGGADELKLDDCGIPDDNTDLNASTGRHGLLRKLSGTTTELLDGDGNWNTSINSRIVALESVSPIITQWTPDAPPTGSAHAKTDEFDSGSAWDGKWTEFDQSGELTPTVANGFGVLSLVDQGGATTRNVGMYQAVPAVAAYAFACKMHMAQPGNVSGNVQMGLFLSQDLGSAPTTADWEGIRLIQGAGLNFATWTATAYNAAFGALSGNLGRTDRSAYFRCRVTSTTTVAWDWSDDGIGWHELTNHTIGFTPVHMGVWCRNAGAGGPATFRTQWFRVVEATVANADLVPGGRVLNVFA